VARRPPWYAVAGTWWAWRSEADADALAAMMSRVKARDGDKVVDEVRSGPRAVILRPGSHAAFGSFLVFGPGSLLAALRVWRSRVTLDADLVRRCATVLEQVGAGEVLAGTDPDVTATLVQLGLARTKTDAGGRVLLRPMPVARR
jgi:hypothetical protein